MLLTAVGAQASSTGSTRAVHGGVYTAGCTNINILEVPVTFLSGFQSPITDTIYNGFYFSRRW